MNTIAEIAKVIKSLKSAVIFTHMRPDGDTLGSAMALSRALSLLQIPNEVLNEGEIPARFFFLEGVKSIRRTPTIDAQAYICVDTSDENRLGELRTVFRKGNKLTINIDHHISNPQFCRYNFVRERSSNCENIAELLKAMGIRADRTIASYLLTGMVTDSGSFSHGDVNGATLRAAAECVEAGADIAEVTYEAFKRQSLARAKFYAETISRVRFMLDGRFAVALVTQEKLAEYGLTQDATEGIVDFGLTVDTVEVSVCLLEVRKEQYKVSFRSKRVNVNEIAGVYGGGGHILSSGCMLFGQYEEVCDRLSYTVSQRLP